MHDRSEVYHYMNELHAWWQVQQDRITQLEALLAQLTADMAQLKNDKPIHIDKIEYHFDQLKVEKLEGTLNIGFTPSALGEQVEELSVNGADISNQHNGGAPPTSQTDNDLTDTNGEAVDPKDMTGGIGEGTAEEPPKTEALRKVRMQMEHYFNGEFQHDLYHLCAQHQLPIDPDFYPMIADEMRKQIEPRIRHYFQAFTTGSSPIHRNALAERIYTQTKQDVRIAIENFIRGLPHAKDGS